MRFSRILVQEGGRRAGAIALVFAGASCRLVMEIDEKIFAPDAGLASNEGGESDGSIGEADPPDACGAGYSMCPTGCALLGGDDDNCGVCGRSCGGAKCDEGRCTGTVVMQSGGSVNVLAESGDALFWPSETPTPRIRRITKAGLDLRTVSPAAAGITGIAVGEPYVYWATPAGNITRALTDGGTPDSLGSGQTGASMVALDAMGLYFTINTNPGNIRRIPLGGTQASTLGTAVSKPRFVAVDDTTVFFSADDPPDQGIWRMTKGGNAQRKLYAGSVLGLALDDSWVFTVDLAAKTITRFPKAGGDAVTLAPADGVGGLDVDDTFLYWTAANGEVWRVTKSGGFARAIALAHVNPGVILASDPKALYWTAGQSIFTTPK